MTTKPAVSRDLILAARKGLLPVSQRAWLGGFGNMLRKELGQWWGTRLGLIQTLTWVVILNGISTIVMFTETVSSQELLVEVVQTFLPMSIIAIAIGAVITAQGGVVGEKQLGTAAWVMSKPASRSAFILSKFIAYAVGFGVTAVLIPSVIFFFAVREWVSASFPVIPFLMGAGVVVLNLLFYLALTLMLGTLFGSRGPIAGIGIAIIMGGLLLKGFIPMEVMVITPWPLQDITGGLALQMPMPSIWFVPVLATGVWIVVMLAVALWRFNREEF